MFKYYIVFIGVHVYQGLGLDPPEVLKIKNFVHQSCKKNKNFIQNYLPPLP